MNNRNNGFTLIELLIVFAIVAILVVIVTVAYRGIINDTSKESAAAAAKQVSDMVHLYNTEKGSFPQNLSSIDLGDLGGAQLQYESSGDSFCLTVVSGKGNSYMTHETTRPKSGGCPGHAQAGRPAVTNLAYNPGAERVNVGWSSNNSATYPRTFDNTKARTGSYSVSAANINTATTLLSLYAVGGQDNYGFPAESNKPYTVSVYFTADVPHKGYIYCSFRSNGTYTTVGSAPQITGKVGEWTRTSYTCNSPANTDRLRIIGVVLALSSQPAGTKGYMDDFMATEGDVLYEYSDGNSPDWIWKGAQNKSVSVGPALL